MEQRLSILTLGVADLEAAEKFYTEVFGWSKSDKSQGDITFFECNGMLLALYPRKTLAEDAAVDAAGTGFRGFTVAYNARSEAEVDELFARFSAAGVNILKPQQKVFWGGYSGYIADPDGNAWEIAYNPYLKIDKKGNLL